MVGAGVGGGVHQIIVELGADDTIAAEVVA